VEGELMRKGALTSLFDPYLSFADHA